MSLHSVKLTPKFNKCNHHHNQSVEQFFNTCPPPETLCANSSLTLRNPLVHLLSKGSNLIIKIIYYRKNCKHKKTSFFFFFKGNPCGSAVLFCFLNLFIYFWLCWVFVSVQGLSLVAASGGHSSSRCVGLSLSRPLLLRSTGSRRAGSVVVAHGPSCSTACGIFPDQGLNPCPLHWQADSQPLRHQGSPKYAFNAGWQPKILT